MQQNNETFSKGQASRKVCLCRRESRLSDVIVVCVHRDVVCETRFRLTFCIAVDCPTSLS